MENQIAQSPTAKETAVAVEVKPMTFPEAMLQVITGKKVTKLEWQNSGIYAFLNGEFLSLHKEDGRNYQWIVRDGDLLGNDWVITQE